MSPRQEKCLDDFKTFVAEALHSEGRYQKFIPTVQEIKNTWRDTAPYKIETEKFVIRTAKTYIIINLGTDIEDLRTVISAMAGYIAKYAARAPQYENNLDMAQKYVFNTLFTNFVYINRLIERQNARKQNKQPKKEYFKKCAKQAQNLADEFLFRASSDGQLYVKKTTPTGSKILAPDNNAVVRLMQNTEKQR